MRIAIAATVALAGCVDERLSAPAPQPVIEAAAVAANPNNVISAVVTARFRFVDSVAVRYGQVPTLDSTSPVYTVAGDSAVVPLLGLLPATDYDVRVVAYGGGDAVDGNLLRFSTGTLPTDLPRYVASGPDPSPGYVVFAAGRYGLVIDNTGRVVWYHRFPTGAGLNFQPQPTGRYVARPTTPDPMDLDPWVEVDVLGNVTRTFGCVRNLVPRFHDLVALADGSYWVMCDETRSMDLTAIGGLENAQVMGTVVQHVSGEGVLLFEWSPFDYFDLTDLDSLDRLGPSVNWTHGNAIDVAPDGDLIVSFRSLSEVTKIDTETGAVLWRMGGRRNQFQFAGGPGRPFVRQHGVRLTGEGRLTLLDNLGEPSGSRAERYVYDDAARTASRIGSYGPSPAVTALLGGTTQSLPRNRTLVAYGNGECVQEYDAGGAVVWQIEGRAGYVFRAERIRSLYRPGVGDPR